MTSSDHRSNWTKRLDSCDAPSDDNNGDILAPVALMPARPRGGKRGPSASPALLKRARASGRASSTVSKGSTASVNSKNKSKGITSPVTSDPESEMAASSTRRGTTLSRATLITELEENIKANNLNLTKGLLLEIVAVLKTSGTTSTDQVTDATMQVALLESTKEAVIAELRANMYNMTRMFSEKMQAVEAKFEAKIKELEANFQNSTRVTTAPLVSNSALQSSWADVVTSGPTNQKQQWQTKMSKKNKKMTQSKALVPEKSRHVLLVTAKDGTTSGSEVVKTIQKSVPWAQEKICVKTLKATKSGNKAIIELDTAEDTAKVTKALEEEGTLEAQVPEKLSPQVILQNVPEEFSSDYVVEQICLQNKDIAQYIAEQTEQSMETFKPFTFVYARKARNDGKHFIFRIPAALHQILLKIRKVPCAYTRLIVGNYEPVLRCYKCLEFGHSQKTCSSHADFCGHCAEAGHKGPNCPKKEDTSAGRCINCLRANSKKFSGPRLDVHHSAFAMKCPCFQRTTRLVRATVDHGGN